MVDNENKSIENAINFYMLANRLKYIMSSENQSLADQIYGSMILATAINSEYEMNINISETIKMILLEQINKYYNKETMEVISKLNKKDLYSSIIHKYHTTGTEEVFLSYHSNVIEKQLQYFFETCEKENIVETDNIDKLYLIAKKQGITRYFGPDEKNNFEIFRFYYLNRGLKQKVRSGWDSTHWNISNDRIERISEHCVGTIALAIALHSELEYNINLDKVIFTLCVHEIGEIKIGDITPFDNITPEQKQEIEHKAIIEVLGNLSQKDKISNLIFEFDKKETKEAKFAYYCDKLEADIQSKIYQDMGCHNPLTDQQNNVVFKSEKIQKMLKDGVKTPFDIWYEYDKSIYKEDPAFTKTLNYIKKTKLK